MDVLELVKKFLQEQMAAPLSYRIEIIQYGSVRLDAFLI